MEKVATSNMILKKKALWLWKESTFPTENTTVVVPSERLTENQPALQLWCSRGRCCTEKWQRVVMTHGQVRYYLRQAGDGTGLSACEGSELISVKLSASHVMTMFFFFSVCVWNTLMTATTNASILINITNEPLTFMASVEHYYTLVMYLKNKLMAVLIKKYLCL